MPIDPAARSPSQTDIGISVVMPVHNGEAFLASAIESVLQQTHRNFEFIIVNDASTDTTQSIIDAYCLKDKRIRALKTNARHPSGARNAGIAVSQHAYVAFVDADDMAFPQRLERQLTAALKQPEVAVWGAFMQCITDDNHLMHLIRSGATTVDEFNAIDRTRQIIRCYGTVAFCQRDVLEKTGGFDTAVVIKEDSELWDRMAAYGPTLIVPEVLQFYRQHARSISVTKLQFEQKWQNFILERYKAKLSGAELRAEEYDKAYQLSPLHRASHYMQSVSQLYGRKYKIARAKNAYLQAWAAASVSFLAYPTRFLTRR